MSGKFLLDTNIVIALFRGDAAVQRNLAKAEKVFIPAIVLGELYYGALKSGQTEKNLAQIEEFVGGVAVLTCNVGTAREYGVIKNQLRAKGRPIPENDIWIAAIARQHDLVLVSRDDHFAEVEDLRLEKW
ncbi:type II toxin-antitoxin system VapC family toxin [Ammonifex thiophilus]|uniref:Ribonuclease VapC n=1 Tax=Ammonifex thiophilus TaxID=444093 RepID=A0A3D8P6P9_9THEO|nr:type II toxin-antitoxin system VapC family toxin [Ammonifex thiophilus]RDV83908.1 type II toxin-antitoxin system VapC family toxin [Ammonifex thiophilus]